MRICIIVETKSKMRNGFKIAEIGEICNADIVLSEINVSGAKRRILRRIKAVCKTFGRIGATLCAASSCFPYLEELKKTGPTTVTEKELMHKLRAEMALAFAEKKGTEADFFIVGGSAAAVADTAKKLLKHRRRMYVECADFKSAEEIVFAETGVGIQGAPESEVIRLDMNSETNFIKYGEETAGFSDFGISVCGIECENISEQNLSALASALEICGFLRKKEIKVVCLLK